MYQLLALINGIIITIMISVNGNLSGQYSVFTATAIIHGVGSLFALLLCARKKNKESIWTHSPKWMYLGGAIGVITTVSQNFAFGAISITSVIALGLLGQMVTSLVIDGLGLFGMEKRPIRSYALVGLGISIFGIFIMLESTVTTAVIAVGISFISGISLVLSRTVNARLAEKTGALQGSLVNHLVGLPITVLIAFVIAKERISIIPASGSFQPWIYLGGILGVVVIMVLNIIVPKIPAFQLTMLVFIGQIFSGICLDVIIGNPYSDTSFEGGIVIAIGVAIHMIMERVNDKKERQHQEYLAMIKRTEDEYREYLVEEYYKKLN